MTGEDDSGRWGIWIDVEGFSALWSAKGLGLRGLNRLTEMVYAIGTRCYPDVPDRLFAHQIGDAYYIASDFREESLDRCAAIAVMLMRGMMEAGCVARGIIVEGDLADYSGTRPRIVQAAATRHGDSDTVALGSGLMTLQAIMGKGIIDANAIDKISGTKGALLLIEAERVSRLSADFITRPLDRNPELRAIDWIHSFAPPIEQVRDLADFPPRTEAELEALLSAYPVTHAMKPEWSEPTLKFAGCRCLS